MSGSAVAVVRLRELARLHPQATDSKQAVTHAAWLLGNDIPARLRRVHGHLGSLPHGVTALASAGRALRVCEDAAESLEERGQSSAQGTQDVIRLAVEAAEAEAKVWAEVNSLLTELTLHWKPMGLMGNRRAEQALTRTVTETLKCKLVAQQASWATRCSLDGDTTGKEADPLSPPIVEECRVLDVLEDTMHAVSALTMEKHGIRPDFILQAEPPAGAESDNGGGSSADSPTMSCNPGHLHYIFTEVLKNAAAASIKRHGIDADLDGPIHICTRAADGQIAVRVADSGCGITFPERSLSQRWFHTTVPYTEPTYTFSGNFGGQLEGRGVGLPMAALHARLYGGDVSLDGLPGDGCTAHVYLAADAKIG